MLGRSDPGDRSALFVPTHAGVANAAFRPTAEEVAYFLGLLTAFAAGPQGFFSFTSSSGADHG